MIDPHWISAWMLVTRLLQCLAFVFLLQSLDWISMEKLALEWMGIL
jgi:hypothetical protein